MRTTVDLPPDLHGIAKVLATEEGITMSDVVSRLMRAGLGERSALEIDTDTETGLPVLSIGRRLTSDEAQRLLDDD